MLPPIFDLTTTPIPAANAIPTTPIAIHISGKRFAGAGLGNGIEGSPAPIVGGANTEAPNAERPALLDRVRLPSKMSRSSISSWTLLYRAFGSRSRHLAAIRLNAGGTVGSTSERGTARSCVRFTRLAIALSARNGR